MAGKNPIAERLKFREAPTLRKTGRLLYMKSPAWRKKAPSTQWADHNRIDVYLVPALGAERWSTSPSASCASCIASLCAPERADVLARKGGADKSVRRGGEGGARRTMRLLKAILAFAVEEHDLPENPAARLKLGVDGQREAAPDFAAYARFWAAIEKLRHSPTRCGVPAIASP